MKDLKPYIDFLKTNNVPENIALKQLASDSSGLTKEEKTLIFRFCYPRLLGDRELPERIIKFRKDNKSSANGFLEPNLGETTLILEASQTPQYSRFIKHLYNSFKDISKISPAEGIEKNHCPFCNKVILNYQLWNSRVADTENSEEEKNKEFLAFTSPDTDIKICRNCLIQLLYSFDLMKNLDPNFLFNWN